MISLQPTAGEELPLVEAQLEITEVVNELLGEVR
jgi:hypothetical protein